MYIYYYSYIYIIIHSQVLSSILCKVPVDIVQWTDGTRLQPKRNAVEMKGMITSAPGHGALGIVICRLIGLALNAGIHNMIATNGAVVNDNVPRPESDCNPFLHLKTFAIANGRQLH